MSARRILVFGAAAAALLLAPRAAQAQQGAWRFEITAVGDSTISFHVSDAPWVRVGLAGIAVDPSRRDALVARFSVIRVEGALATAVVTGQTTRVSTADVALLVAPKKHWYEQPAVWITAGAGIVLGMIIAR
ncbi:MAG TPA: hypothetical protein VMT93_01080 [Gemmatimonadaceae bacterium]|nr:hypothetical protein [Gemmatimonadaceae bacterium]